MRASSLAASLARTRAFAVSIGAADRLAGSRAGLLHVLTYHRVTDEPGVPPGILSARPDEFERQIAILAARYRPVGLTDMVRAREQGAPLPARAVLVTFDDAYEDFAEHAWPVLRHFGVPVTLFVPTAFPGDPSRRFWWDRLHGALLGGTGELETPVGTLPLGSPAERLDSYRRLRDWIKAGPPERETVELERILERLPVPKDLPGVLGWDDLRRLAREGVTLAPHTRTHPRLAGLPPGAIEAEARGSLDDLEREVGPAPRALAYPAGSVSDATERALERAGFRLGFASGGGVNDIAHMDWLRVARINVGARTGTGLLRLRLLPFPVRRRAPVASRPKVAYVMSRFPKLSETFVLGEILALERLGVDVALYPLLRHHEATVHPEAEALVGRANYLPFLSLPILRSQLHFLRRRPRAYLGALAAVARGTLGSLNFFVGGLSIFPKVAHAARLMEAEGVTHVHCHFANHPAVAGLVIRRLTGIPFSFTAHGSDLHVERRMLPQKVAEAAFVATISHDNRRLIVAECGDGADVKVHVVRAGIDTEAFAPRGERNGHEGLRIVCVGTLHEVKGQAVLVEACRLLQDRGVEFECRFVGDGPDRDALRGAAETAGLGERVILVGPQPREAVAATLEWADVLAAPSVPTHSGKREGIPVVLMEAMSSGLPVVASRLSGIPELVEDGFSGLLVPHGDPRALADALERLARDPLLRRRLGRQGRLTVEREFDIDRSAALLAERFR